jgi:hypothetical protein
MKAIFSRFFVVIITSAFVQVTSASWDIVRGQNHELEACSIYATSGKQCLCEVSKLRPTQIAVGMIEVAVKVKSLKKMDQHDLRDFLLKNPAPSIVGPGGELFITDHHHLARSLRELGVPYMVCDIQANFSYSSFRDFWLAMDKNHWLYPFDEYGRGPLPVSMIPTELLGLRDDLYRSLAFGVRENGGYKKTSQSYADFSWAQYFRSRIAREQIENDFHAAVKQGLALAHSPDASSLPGYIPRD